MSDPGGQGAPLLAGATGSAARPRAGGPDFVHRPRVIWGRVLTVLWLLMPVGQAPPSLDWIYASPAQLIEFGERTGVFRIAATRC
jgi:hypothetical protein